ncbi:MAG: lysophospholipid acyltransferase family protein [Gemmatimonadales bacterium]|nr:lysophospholipid acyltransferase family protein [Gemmatimonadales bacterium]
MASRLRQKLDFGLLYLLYGLARPLPLPWLRAFGRGLGSFVWHFVGYRRTVVLDNLNHAFGQEKSPAEIKELGRSFYRNLGMTLMEFLAFPGISGQDLLEMVEFEGEEYLQELKDLGRGGLFVSGHFGNWELFAARVSSQDVPVSFIVKAQSNAAVDRVQNEIRLRAGIGIIRAGAGIKQMVRVLRNKELVGMLADQDAGKDGIFIDFLGRPASVFRGPAYFAWKLDIPMLPAFIFRRPDGNHVGRFLPLVHPDPNWTEEEAVANLTRIHVKSLEAAIREAPDQYLWTHRRWKTKPPEDGN